MAVLIGAVAAELWLFLLHAVAELAVCCVFFLLGQDVPRYENKTPMCEIYFMYLVGKVPSTFLGKTVPLSSS